MCFMYFVGNDEQKMYNHIQYEIFFLSFFVVQKTFSKVHLRWLNYANYR